MHLTKKNRQVISHDVGDAMTEAIGPISILILFGVISFFVLRSKPTSNKEYKDLSAKPLFIFFFRFLGVFFLLFSVLALLGGPDGKIGSKESIIYGSVGLLITGGLFLVARSVQR